MSLKDSTRKYLVVGLALFIVGGLTTASFRGGKQDNNFRTDNELYSLVTQQLEQGNYEIALAGTKTLEDSQQSSEVVNYIIGLAAVNSGEMAKGVRHLQRVLDINPHKVEDSMFMLQLAEAMVLAEMKNEAELVLERCLTLPTPESFPHYQERIVELQQQLATQM